MGYGYTGRILNVDLTRGTTCVEEVPAEVYEAYLAGTGLASFILHDRIPPGADPFGEENILAFVSGLLTGTGALFSGRWMAAGKSPLTGGWGDANCGGILSPAIKRNGYDGIFFSGKSEGPVYLYVKDGRPEIRDASHLWGRDTVETEETLIAETGGTATVAAVGPAGERLSLIAGISHEKGRLAARSGLGAVMGAKRLKALVLDGKRRIDVFDRAEIRDLSRRCNRWVRLQPPFLPAAPAALIGTLMRVLPFQMAMDGMVYKILLRKWGTGSMNQISVEMGDAPVKNWKGTNRDWGLGRSYSVNPDAVARFERMKYHCYSCPLGCGGICVDAGPYGRMHKPEYETVIALGALCMNDDLGAIMHMNEMLNRAGMDTISAGGTIAFAMECFENGILTRSDLDGLELKWGDSGAMIALVEKMIRREGIGDVLADGSRAAAEKIGRGAEALAMHAGGQELPMHDGRNDPGFNVHYSVEATPGRHTIGAQLYYEMFRLWTEVEGLPRPPLFYMKGRKYLPDEEKALAAAACSRFMNVANGAGLCLFGLFLGVDRIPVFSWLNAATGWRLEAGEYMEIGRRIQDRKQAFNIRQGVDPLSFRVPDRAAGRPPQTAGANRGRGMDIVAWMRDYWRVSGWDEARGTPGRGGSGR
ncbi:MAG TPA: aldehyde ferredoxin oxidoreductase family protein [Syntrophales bacterium]|nr:aldehyde ferredoxin oxidoreductase family protein [Syntrophales bacterium]HPC01058.1 aldehyde ferredoxin oxidoreductase family protein [Syntrophales bacterium]HRS86880.1 aldehyde ferredoxin oxidoreductase family protein [Syntrophales bacterium]HRV42515.1 aldehyde ferredoxin oxidoreductase family protein [Syntrophales bacterium]